MSNEIAIILSLQTANALSKMNEFLGEAGAGLKDLAQQVSATFLSFEGLKRLGEGVSEAIKLEEAVGRLQERTGLSLTTINALKIASTDSGVSFDELSRSLTNFNAKIYDAVTNGGKVADMFRMLGVELKNSDGSLRSSDQILLETVESFKKLGSVQQDAVAKGLFGKAGFELIPMFNALGAAIDEVKEKGSPITEESVAQAMEFERTLRQLQESVEMVFVAIANDLLPSLQKMADQFKSVASSSDYTSESVNILGGIIKGLITVVVPLALAFYDLGKSFGVAAAVLEQNFEVALKVVQELIHQAIQLVQDLVQEVKDMYEGLATAAQAGLELLHGNISTARQLISEQFDDIVEHGKKTVTDAGKLVSESTSTVLSGVGQMFSNYDSMWGGFYSDLTKQWDGLKGFMTGLWNPGSLPKHSAPKSGGSGGQFFPGPSTEDVKNLKELDAIMAELFKQQEKLIQSNPFESQADKAKQLLPIIEQQKQAVLEQYEAARTQLSNPNTTDANKVALTKELVKLQGQYNDLVQKGATLNDPNNFLQQWAKAFTKIQYEWGGWAKQTAATFENVFNNAVKSISKGITDLILQTKTWSQALREIGMSILTSIIQGIVQMGVQWVLTQLVMAVAGKAIMASAVAEMVPMAALASSIWSGPATLATIASYGGAAAQAPGLIAIAEGLTLGESLTPRAMGGPVSAGTPYIVGENQPELFVPDRSGYVYPSVPQGGGGGGQNHFHVLPIMERAEAARYVLDHPEANHIMVETVNQNRSKIIPRKF